MSKDTMPEIVFIGPEKARVKHILCFLKIHTITDGGYARGVEIMGMTELDKGEAYITAYVPEEYIPAEERK